LWWLAFFITYLLFIYHHVCSIKIVN